MCRACPATREKARRLLVDCTVLVAALVLIGFAPAGEPPAWVPEIVRQDNCDVLDLDLALRARESLARDPALAGLNLVISVRSRVATLRGIMTATEVEAQARACLRTVSGLTDVKSELHCEAPETPQRRQLALGPIQVRVPIAEPIIIQAPRTQAALVRRHPEDGWTPSPPLAWRPGTSSNSPEKMRSGSQNQSLREAIDALRLGDWRFREITADMHGHTVSLKGRVYRFEHAAELAQAIARLPGVERVLLDQVRVDPPP
jgi:hypothetical protein